MFRSAERVTFGRCPKSDQKDSQKPRFLDFLHAVPPSNLIPYPKRSQNTVDIVTYDESSAPLAPLPLTFSTVEPKALFGVGISGSGAGAKAILLTKRKRKFCVNVWQAVTNLYAR